MSDLPPDLFQGVSRILLPLVQTVSERQATLPPGLGDITARIRWEGSTEEFLSHLAGLLSPGQLVEVLRYNRSKVGAQEQPTLDRLCDRLNALRPHEELTADPLTAYRQRLVRDLTDNPRYQLDKRFVRLTLLLDQGPDAQGARFVEPPDARTYDDLRTLLRENPAERAFVVLGAPGAGKSTLLRRLQLEDVLDQLGPAAGHTDSCVSYFVSLNAYPRDNPPPPADWLSARWQVELPGLGSFESCSDRGGILLLLDALNELRHHDRADLTARIEAWHDFLPGFVRAGNTVVLSCRSLDYSIGLSTKDVLDVRQVNIKPMAPEQIHEFLRAYTSNCAERAWEQLKDDQPQLELFSTPFLLRLLVNQIDQDGHVPRGRAALFTGFVRAALRRELDARDHLLCDDDTLLDARDRARIFRNEWRPDVPGDLPERGCLIPKLSELAFQMQRSGLRGEGTQVRITEADARGLLAHTHARDILDTGVRLNVLDEDTYTDEILFAHQLLQEYFGGRTMARRLDATLVRSEWRTEHVTPRLTEIVQTLADYEPLPPPPTTGWEETAVMAASLAAHPDGFVRDLADVNLPLAGRCAAAPDVHVAVSLQADLKQRLLVRMTDAGADLRARIAAGLALGNLGDPRFASCHGPLGDYLAPPLVTIQAGDYTMGDDKSAEADEKPARAVRLAEFQIGQYPVTNAEYALFMQAGGYADERWWDTPAALAWLRGENDPEDIRTDWRATRTRWQRMDEKAVRQWRGYTSQQINSILGIRRMSDEDFDALLAQWYPSGTQYRRPDYWNDPAFNNPAQPVVGVCWHEARAYCAWLSAQTGQPFRLPTEVEWEAAARGKAGRRFAYGDTFDAARCNTYESHIRRTTPVGLYVKGNTPEGIADLCGNCWEWTSSAYLDYPYTPAPEREDAVRPQARRVVRGGSWDFIRDSARASCRSADDPNFRYYYVGFRVVSGSAPVSRL